MQNEEVEDKSKYKLVCSLFIELDRGYEKQDLFNSFYLYNGHVIIVDK
jgi:hypothetical protein